MAWAAEAKTKSAVLDTISDVKEFKKLLRTRINVLVLFVKDKQEAAATIKIFHEASIKGQGTLVLMDCSNRLVQRRSRMLIF